MVFVPGLDDRFDDDELGVLRLSLEVGDKSFKPGSSVILDRGAASAGPAGDAALLFPAPEGLESGGTLESVPPPCGKTGTALAGGSPESPFVTVVPGAQLVQGDEAAGVA